MDWIQGLQRAINYVEDNLTDEIDINTAANKAYVSSFHFQRTFSIMTGMTISEYIRNRKLSLAGEELSISNAKVIDIAFKYGYDTPESFTKAFTRFHGITPSQARHAGAKLKSFNRLSIKIIIEGGSVMEYRIEKRDKYKVLVKARSYPTTIGNDNDVVMPKFWGECYKDGTAQTLREYDKNNELLGICEPEQPELNIFRYGIGVECESNVTAPEGYEMWDIPAQNWAVFKCVGAMPKAIQNMWKRIYSEFFSQSEYEGTGGIDFELYYDGDNDKEDYVSEIWIPVRKKS